MNVYQYYNNPRNSRSYNDLVNLFTNNDYADDIVSIISEYIEGKFDISIISKFDALIDRIVIVS